MTGGWLWWFVAIFVVHAIIAFIMSPPTFLSDKFFAAVAVHPKLREDDVALISVNGVELTGEAKAQFIQGFNEANFLFHGGLKPELNEEPIDVQIKQGKSDFMFTMYVYGNQIEILRHKKKTYVPYRVQSPLLQRHLVEIREAV